MTPAADLFEAARAKAYRAWRTAPKGQKGRRWISYLRATAAAVQAEMPQ